eukprot:4043990-Prymnesium_polylepis.1
MSASRSWQQPVRCHTRTIPMVVTLPAASMTVTLLPTPLSIAKPLMVSKPSTSVSGSSKSVLTVPAAL